MSEKKITQRDRVLSLLKTRGSEGMSAIEMLRFGVYRAAARVAELREEGFEIETVNEHGKTALYILREKEKAPEGDGPRIGLDPSLWDAMESAS